MCVDGMYVQHAFSYHGLTIKLVTMGDKSVSHMLMKVEFIFLAFISVILNKICLFVVMD